MIFATCVLVSKIRIINSLLTLIQFVCKSRNALVLRIIGRIFSAVVELFYSCHSFYLDTIDQEPHVSFMSIYVESIVLYANWLEKIHTKGMGSVLGLKSHIKCFVIKHMDIYTFINSLILVCLPFILYLNIPNQCLSFHFIHRILSSFPNFLINLLKSRLYF